MNFPYPVVLSMAPVHGQQASGPPERSTFSQNRSASGRGLFDLPTGAVYAERTWPKLGGCGACPGACSCALASGTTTKVSGTGDIGDPYVIEMASVVESTNSLSLSGNGSALAPIRGSVAVSGRVGNAISVRDVGNDPGLWADVPIKAVLGPDGNPYSPDGVGQVSVSAASLRAGLASSMPWATLDVPNSRWNFTPATGDGYVWGTVGGVVGWYDIDTVLDTSSLANGEATFDRAWGLASEAALSLSTVHLTVFTAKRTQSCASVTVWSGSAATAAAPTNLWLGVYSVGGTWTRLATTADVVGSVLTATETSYQVNFAAPWAKVAGTKYAVAVLQVGGTAAKVAGPALRNLTAASYKNHFTVDGPTMYANIAGTTLPASIDPANLVSTGNMVPLYAWMRP